MLNRLNGDLHIEQVPLNEIAREHGTPAFVYSANAIRAAYQSFDGAFERHPHRVCYAVKANSSLAVLQLLVQQGAWFDIVSGGELQRVLSAGGRADRVVFSGVGKQDWEIKLALTEGIACFNVESASELQRIEAVATRLGKTAPVSIRVNPDVDPGTHPYIATGLKQNKFGVSAEEAIPLYEHAAESDHLGVVGIDCHIGSQITELAPFLDALNLVLNLVDDLSAMNINVDHIDLGGGLGVKYQDEQPVDVNAFAGAIIQAMGKREQTLLFEPGRFIVANAGLLLTEVITTKNNKLKDFAVTDAAMNDLIRPALYQSWQEVVTVSERTGEPRSWDIVGPVCETGDFLARDRNLVIEEGDLLAVLSSGAYGFVMSSNYNTRPRAAEVMVDGDQHFCIRRRETIEDLLALESLLPAD